MLKIVWVLLAALGFGCLLALPGISWPLRPGWFGAAALIAAAFAARRYWDRRAATAGDDPGAPEREVWYGLAGTAVVGGHLIACLLQPGIDLHVGHGNTLAIDNWTLIGGTLASYYLVHNGDLQRDERDRAISARGMRVGYLSLIVLLIALLLGLGFAPAPALAPLSHWVLANLLIVLIMLSVLALHVAQLLGYWRDARPPSESTDG